jgi:DNA polymerase-1
VARGELRECFIAPEGRSLVVCDYSQIELRLAANISNDARMLEMFRRRVDLHSATAAIVLDKPVAEVTKEDRQIAKAVNFGLLYGQSARGLVRYAKTSYGVTLSEDRAREIRERFFGAYIGLSRWHKERLEQARGSEIAEARTLLGRRRLLPQGDAWPRFTTLVNMPVQGTAADGIKKALVLLSHRLPEGARIVATIHDEIVVECPEEIAPTVLGLMRGTMIEGVSSIAGGTLFEVEGGIGATWGQAK